MSLQDDFKKLSGELTKQWNKDLGRKPRRVQGRLLPQEKSVRGIRRKRRSINIINKTHWRDDDLRKFVSECAKQVFDTGTYCKLNATFTYTRNSRSNDSCSGVGYYYTGDFLIRIPSAAPDKVDLALTIYHELSHCLGIKHDKMRGDSRYRRVGNWRERYAWANELPLRVKEVKKKAKPTTDLKIIKLQEQIKKLTTKRKRLDTLIKKRTQALKRQQKKLEATF